MGEEVRVWYDAEGDYLEVLFARTKGYFRETDHRVCKEASHASQCLLNRSARHWYTDTDAQTQALGGSGGHGYESHVL